MERNTHFHPSQDNVYFVEKSNYEKHASNEKLYN
jgi:hypothetical protein